MKIPLSNPFKRYSQKVGLPPGTLVYTGEERIDPVRITLIDYDETHLHEEEAQTIGLPTFHGYDCFYILYPFNLYRRYLRHEFQIHARA